MKSMWIGLSVLLLLGSLALAGEITDSYNNLPPEKRAISPKSKAKGPIRLDEHHIMEIGLERTGIIGDRYRSVSSAYSVRFRVDGTVRYEDIQHGPYQGIRTGQIPPRIFHRLAKLIKEKGYQDFDNNYGDAVLPGGATNFTTVVIGNSRKVVRNYDDRGPDDLWAIEELIDHVMRTYVTWNSPTASTSAGKNAAAQPASANNGQTTVTTNQQ